VKSSGNYIRAKSLYYDEPSFSDVSINMSSEEEQIKKRVMARYDRQYDIVYNVD